MNKNLLLLMIGMQKLCAKLYIACHCIEFLPTPANDGQ